MHCVPLSSSSVDSRTAVEGLRKCLFSAASLCGSGALGPGYSCYRHFTRWDQSQKTRLLCRGVNLCLQKPAHIKPVNCSGEHSRITLNGDSSTVCPELLLDPCCTATAASVRFPKPQPEGLKQSEDNGAAYGTLDHTESTCSLLPEEIERRQKIALQNKGRVPWNKGKKHSEETRERIRQRTREALSDPKVRKKMGWARSHRPQSAETRAKISLAQRKRWGERLLLKRSQNNIYSCWANGVAEAARRGGHGQGELCWESYQVIKIEMTSRYLHQKAEKEKLAMLKRLRAMRLAAAVESKPKMDDPSKEEQQTSAEPRRRRRSSEIKKLASLSRDLKLKERLVKVMARLATS